MAILFPIWLEGRLLKTSLTEVDSWSSSGMKRRTDRRDVMPVCNIFRVRPQR